MIPFRIFFLILHINIEEKKKNGGFYNGEKMEYQRGGNGLKEFMRDSFLLKGTSFSEFEDLIQEIDKKTSVRIFHSSNISLFSVQKRDDFFLATTLPFARENEEEAEYLWRTLYGGAKEMKFLKQPPDFLLRELKNVGAVIKNPESMFLSKYAIPRLAYKVGIQGDFAYENNLLRNLAIQYRLSQKERAIQMVIREDEGIKKVFGVLTDKYQYVPFSILLDIIREIKREIPNISCRTWNINAEGAEIQIEFPLKSEEFSKLYGKARVMIPGIILSTSDIGWRSFSIQETWRKGNFLIKGKKFSMCHRKYNNFSPKEVAKELKKEIFDKFFVFPKAIAELSEILVCEEDAANLLDYVLHESKLKMALGQKRSIAFIDETMFCTDWSLPITAYTLYLSIIELTEGDYPSSTKVLVEEAVYKAAYVKAWKKFTQ